MYKVGQKLISEIRTSRTQKSATRFKKVSDSVNLTAKSNLAKCGQEINPIKNFFNHLYLKLINPKKMSFKFFKETGGHFEGNVAFFKEKRFTGDIVKKAGSKTYLLKYEDGLIQNSITIPKNSREPRRVKAYEYECGKLKQIQGLLSIAEDKAQVLCRTDITDKQIKRRVFDESETRYARMTRIPEAEVPQKIKEAYEEICKQKGIDETVMPKLFVIKKRNNEGAACYSKRFNVILVFSPNFKNMADITNTIEHELTHFQVALNFARVPKNEYNEHLQNVLLNSIGTTEPLEVILDGWLPNKIVEVPKMSKKMIKEFKEFAKKSLYYEDVKKLRAMLSMVTKGKSKTKYLAEQSEFRNTIEKLVNDNPDFVKQFSSYEEAVKQLGEYSLSHTKRYQICLVSGRLRKISEKFPPLSEQEKQKVLSTLSDSVDSLNANVLIRLGEFTVSREYSYLFSGEEVRATVNGNNAAIRRIVSDIEKRRANDTLTPEFERSARAKIERLNKENQYRELSKKFLTAKLREVNSPVFDPELMLERIEAGEALKKLGYDELTSILESETYERILT